MGFFSDVGNFLGDVVTAPFSIASNVLGGLTGQSTEQANQQSQQSANSAFAMSQQSADKQMAFQERMSNTSYQRAMADMQAAGLNPMLAFSQGGASSPGGAAASAQGVQYDDKGAAAIKNIGGAISGAEGASQLLPALAQMKAQTRTANATANQAEQMTPVSIQKQQAETQYTQSAAQLNKAQAEKTRVETKNASDSNAKIAQEIINLKKSGKLQDLDSETRGRINQWQKQHPNFFRMKQVLDSINPFGKSAADQATPGRADH